MSNITCKVIADVLELYSDGVVSEDTKSLVEEHLQNCAECSEKLKLIGQNLTIAAETKAQPLKRIKKKYKDRIIAVCAGALAVVIISISYVFISDYLRSLPPVAVPFEKFNMNRLVETETDLRVNKKPNHTIFYGSHISDDGKTLEIMFWMEVDRFGHNESSSWRREESYYTPLVFFSDESERYNKDDYYKRLLADNYERIELYYSVNAHEPDAVKHLVWEWDKE